mmetsp:Transcript_18391/g.26131  ORF Transcript_18391/g.26131 Transcript_18391/m.26131 type:complete len:168 (-) Transcript_18391:232-735(-)|eukprot:CAMPEP_0172422738 /NCGR_PEP_ID=MMETSP1064-20121228/8875_1 /TAXON_ID=202472 /ORGANISM="Aulacoseira subarctica , Strain CCAP 1002/5" /LENGTH=167 /DNA_ID=CAMNT_0013163757 /DNA_START=141 /DNA_END=644 /DNA_ORIENTATION=+
MIATTRHVAQTPRGNAQTSRTIPFPKCHVPRTSSELQFSQLLMEAEIRENSMFHRIISGLHVKSSERIAKSSSISIADRELIEEQTRVIIEKIIQQRNNEQFQKENTPLYNPLSSIPNNGNESKSIRKESRFDNRRGYSMDWSDEVDMGDNDDDTTTGGEEVFDLDF